MFSSRWRHFALLPTLLWLASADQQIIVSGTYSVDNGIKLDGSGWQTKDDPRKLADGSVVHAAYSTSADASYTISCDSCVALFVVAWQDPTFGSVDCVFTGGKTSKKNLKSSKSGQDDTISPAVIASGTAPSTGPQSITCKPSAGSQGTTLVAYYGYAGVYATATDASYDTLTLAVFGADGSTQAPQTVAAAPIGNGAHNPQPTGGPVPAGGGDGPGNASIGPTITDGPAADGKTAAPAGHTNAPGAGAKGQPGSGSTGASAGSNTGVSNEEPASGGSNGNSDGGLVSNSGGGAASGTGTDGSTPDPFNSGARKVWDGLKARIKKLPKWVGPVIGGVLGAIVLLIIAICCIRKRRQSKAIKARQARATEAAAARRKAEKEADSDSESDSDDEEPATPAPAPILPPPPPAAIVPAGDATTMTPSALSRAGRPAMTAVSRPSPSIQTQWSQPGSLAPGTMALSAARSVMRSNTAPQTIGRSTMGPVSQLSGQPQLAPRTLDSQGQPMRASSVGSSVPTSTKPTMMSRLTGRGEQPSITGARGSAASSMARSGSVSSSRLLPAGTMISSVPSRGTRTAARGRGMPGRSFTTPHMNSQPGRQASLAPSAQPVTSQRPQMAVVQSAPANMSRSNSLPTRGQSEQAMRGSMSTRGSRGASVMGRGGAMMTRSASMPGRRVASSAPSMAATMPDAPAPESAPTSVLGRPLNDGAAPSFVQTPSSRMPSSTAQPIAAGQQGSRTSASPASRQSSPAPPPALRPGPSTQSTISSRLLTDDAGSRTIGITEPEGTFRTAQAPPQTASTPATRLAADERALQHLSPSLARDRIHLPGAAHSHYAASSLTPRELEAGQKATGVASRSQLAVPTFTIEAPSSESGVPGTSRQGQQSRPSSRVSSRSTSRAPTGVMLAPNAVPSRPSSSLSLSPAAPSPSPVSSRSGSLLSERRPGN